LNEVRPWQDRAVTSVRRERPAVAGADPLADLLFVLDLEAIETTIFRGHQTDAKRLRTFGGLVAGQALVAAGRTVSADQHVHSLHAYFLRPGDPTRPIVYEVDRIRDGRSFATRRVIAIQHGEAIFNLSASFHVTEPGVSHQKPMPEVPSAESLPTFRERWKHLEDSDPDWYNWPRPIDQRHVDAPSRERVSRDPRQQLWFRTNGTLPDDPLLHACVAAYASDMSVLDTALIPHGISWDDAGFMGASLDHAMWFHGPFRSDEWLLYDQESTVSGGARGLARGEMYTADGRLVVSVVQEGLMRLRTP
jgi:acyl-CoA thioesterase II